MKRLSVLSILSPSSVFVLASLSSHVASAEPELRPTFPLAISVAVQNGVPVRDDPWIAAQIADANDLFAVTGVSFRWTLRKEIPSAHAELHSRSDRDDLAPLVEKNVIDVFVVAKLEDVDEPGRYRKGVAWTSKRGPRFLVLSAEAFPKVLGHELGHFFGNGHTDVPDNLMSYSRTGGPVAMDETQVEQSRRFAARFLATGRLPDVGPPRFFP